MTTTQIHLCDFCHKQVADDEAIFVSITSNRADVYQNDDLDFCAPGCMLKFFNNNMRGELK